LSVRAETVLPAAVILFVCCIGGEAGLIATILLPEITHLSASGSKVRSDGSVAVQLGKDLTMRSTLIERKPDRPFLVTATLTQPVESIAENPLTISSSLVTDTGEF
jgi:hypothetical protein